MRGPVELHKALAQLEEATGWEGVAHDEAAPPILRIQLSIAISMKRIADKLDEVTCFNFDKPAIRTRED